MQKQIIYRRISAAECAQVVKLHRASFRPEKVSRTIYGTHGVGHYLASLVQFPELRNNDLLFGAWEEHHLVGYLHGRLLGASWHLNEIATHPTRQRCGIGRRLFDIWLEAGAGRRLQDYSLDVEPDAAAFRWYKSLGFEIETHSWMYERPLDAGAGEQATTEAAPTTSDFDALQLREWESSSAWQAAYGFSQLRLATRQRDWLIGRLGETYFRTHEPLPPPVERALAHVDARRRLLLLSSTRIYGSDMEEVATSVRMVKRGAHRCAASQ